MMPGEKTIPFPVSMHNCVGVSGCVSVVCYIGVRLFCDKFIVTRLSSSPLPMASSYAICDEHSFPFVTFPNRNIDLASFIHTHL